MPEQTIKKIKIKELAAFAADCAKDPGYSSIPLSSTRALAHAHNPCADADDVGLLVAYDQGCVAGYLGIMPGHLKIHGQLSKVCWFSAFFVRTEHRNRGLGRALVQEALKLPYDFVTTPASGSSSDRVFAEAGMDRFATWEYRSLDLRACNIPSLFLRLLRKTLRKRKIELACVNSAIRLLDRVFLPLILALFYGLLRPDTYRRLAAIYPKIKTPEKTPGAEFYRGPEVIAWMLQYPWLTEKNRAGPADARYFFAGLPDAFGYAVLGTSTVVSFHTEKKFTVIKALDLDERQNPGGIAAHIWEYAAQKKAGCIEFPKELSTALWIYPWLKFLTVEKKRAYLYHPKDNASPLVRAVKEIRLRFCDGDNAFF